MIIRDDLVGFLNNPENVQRLNGLVEDIRYVLVDYQVCAPKALPLVASDICLRGPHSETPMTRAASRL